MEPQPHPNASSRELELELIRVRAEATAARLEARAAELELMLLAQRPQQRFDATPSTPLSGQLLSEQADFSTPGWDRSRHAGADASSVQRSFAGGHEDAAQSLIFAIRRLVEQGSGDARMRPPVAAAEPLPAAERNASGWASRLNGLRDRGAEPIEGTLERESIATKIEQFADRIAAASRSAVEVPQRDVATSMSPAIDDAKETKKTRVDAGSQTVKRPRLLDLPVAERPGESVGPLGEIEPLPISIAADKAGDEQPKRWRPAGWLISTTAHVVCLLMLGLFTLSHPKPKDQLAFTASVAEASEATVESFTIEVTQEMPDVAEPTPTETAADVSPLGTLQMAEVTLDLPTTAASPLTSAMSGETSSESMKLAEAAVKGDTPSKVQFAGLDGGGNHFVYLVDSSNSMKKFNEARTELLRSIDSLKPDQRFYVVFYDENPKFMRVTNPSQVEPASVYATPENKQAFRRWAMTIQQERGKSPPDVLKFAFKLRPDVIFLLSDGEFSAQTETVIRENNLQENLFGDSGPISIIHTIRYPGVSSTEGRQAEVQMRRIAAENGGQYRNVEIK